MAQSINISREKKEHNQPFGKCKTFLIQYETAKEVKRMLFEKKDKGPIYMIKEKRMITFKQGFKFRSVVSLQ